MKKITDKICQRPRSSDAHRPGWLASALLSGVLLLLLGGGTAGPALAENGLSGAEGAAPYQRHELPYGIAVELPAGWEVSTAKNSDETAAKGMLLKASFTKPDGTMIFLSVKDNKGAPELGLLVREFMVDKSSKLGPLPSWDIFSENLKISWETSGAIRLDNRREQRHGTAIITTNGKEFYQLEQRKVIIPWNITLTGDKSGVQVVSIMPPGECFGSHGSGSDFDFKAAMHLAGISFKQLYEVPAGLGSAGALYKISFPGKRDAWAAYSETWGSGGTTSFLYLIYPKDEKELSPAEYKTLTGEFFRWIGKDEEEEEEEGAVYSYRESRNRA